MTKLMNKLRKQLKSNRGFTLMEVLVAMALIGILMPMTFELFGLGATLMGRSKEMINDSTDVSYAVTTDNLYVEGVEQDVGDISGIESSGTIFVDGLPPGINNVSSIDYKAAQKDDVTYYTYEDQD